MSDFTIRLADLSRGSVCSEGRLQGEFFADGEAFGVHGGDVAVAVRGQYREEGYTFSIRLEGVLRAECDRCLGLFDLPLRYAGELSVRRIPGAVADYEGDVWTVGTEQEWLDLTPYVRDSVYLSLPMRRYHGVAGTDASACDAEMLGYVGAQEGRASGVLLGDSLGIALDGAREKKLTRNQG